MPVAILQPASIQLISSEVAIAWNDRQENYLPLEMLRRACPCAVCGGEPDVLGQVERPVVTYGPQSFTLRSWQVIGGYAWQPFWADGHQTGLYTFPYLRRLGGLIEL